MHHNARLVSLVSALCLGAALGCGGGAPPASPKTPTDIKISRLISDMQDYAHDPRGLKIAVPRLFAPGSEPSDADLQRYADFTYEGAPPVKNGDTATVVVHVKEAKSGKSLGDVTWTMKPVKDLKSVFAGSNGEPAKGEAAPPSDEAAKEVWKLTDAPLPK